MTVNENATANQTITATDPDANALTFSKTSGPPYMTVNDDHGRARGRHGEYRLGARLLGRRYGDRDGPRDGPRRPLQREVADDHGEQRGSPVSLAAIANMSVVAGATADQTFTATIRMGTRSRSPTPVRRS